MEGNQGGAQARKKSKLIIWCAGSLRSNLIKVTVVREHQLQPRLQTVNLEAMFLKGSEQKHQVIKQL